MLVDVHAHLDDKAFENDIDEVIQRAEQAGVKKIITQGVHHESNLKVLELAKKYKIVEAALGMYPINCLNVKIKPEFQTYNKETIVDIDETLKFIEKNKSKIVAIGEVGMDYKYSDDKEPQKENFIKIIKLAKKIDKPLIIHTRNAEEDILNILEEQKVKKADLHVFSGSKTLIKRAAEMKLYFSIPSNIGRLEHFQMLAKIVDINQILTETDCPYLGPIKEVRSEPKDVEVTVKKIAQIKGMTVEEVKNNIYMNYQKLFT